jgi:porphobilinogen synthase
MNYPQYRPRRLRRSESLRRMVRETRLSVDSLVYPLFVAAGSRLRRPIPSLPGQYHWSPDTVVEEARRAYELGIPAVLLFGLPERKDPMGESAADPNGPVQRAVANIKEACPDLVVITDVCLCEYTDHGHCGLVEDGKIVNDATLDVLARVALSHAEAGADIVAPSDMMDGRVGAIREALDEEGWEDVAIMSYAAKYASAFYGPFREAAGSAPQFGDRRSYQMDPPNVREALREIELDINEGADIVMVKPALAYLDVIYRVRQAFDHPVAAYNVSGEYVMVKTAAAQGLLDERRAVLELLTGIRRAGADIIITYHAPDIAQWLREG